MARVELGIRVPRRRFAVELSLVAEAGTTAIAGPSGAGKTTVLRALAGLVRPAAGRIACGEEVWFDAGAGIDLPPERRSVGYVPQDHALFPHLDVRANVGFGARDRDDVPGLLERFGLTALARATPSELSGGERRRVALARALARRPRVLALDEPLTGLDTVARAAVRDELAATLRELGVPVLLVTHDFEDAAALAGRIAVLAEGRLHQAGTPEELRSAPADAFVAAYTGASVVPDPAAPDTRTLALHPWEVRVQRDPPPPGRAGLPGTIDGWQPQGDRVRARVGALTGELSAADAHGLGPGAAAWATWDPATARSLRRSPGPSQEAPRIGHHA